MQGEGVVLVGDDVLLGLQVEDVQLENGADGRVVFDKAHLGLIMIGWIIILNSTIFICICDIQFLFFAFCSNYNLLSID